MPTQILMDRNGDIRTRRFWLSLGCSGNDPPDNAGADAQFVGRHGNPPDPPSPGQRQILSIA
jgi:hypothetical protein